MTPERFKELITTERDLTSEEQQEIGEAIRTLPIYDVMEIVASILRFDYEQQGRGRAIKLLIALRDDGTTQRFVQRLPKNGSLSHDPDNPYHLTPSPGAAGKV